MPGLDWGAGLGGFVGGLAQGIRNNRDTELKRQQLEIQKQAADAQLKLHELQMKHYNLQMQDAMRKNALQDQLGAVLNGKVPDVGQQDTPYGNQPGANGPFVPQEQAKAQGLKDILMQMYPQHFAQTLAEQGKPYDLSPGASRYENGALTQTAPYTLSPYQKAEIEHQKALEAQASRANDIRAAKGSPTGSTALTDSQLLTRYQGAMSTLGKVKSGPLGNAMQGIGVMGPNQEEADARALVESLKPELQKRGLLAPGGAAPAVKPVDLKALPNGTKVRKKLGDGTSVEAVIMNGQPVDPKTGKAFQ